MMHSQESHYVTANGIRIHYLRQGRGSPMILLHGWPEFCHVVLFRRSPQAGDARASRVRSFFSQDESASSAEALEINQLPVTPEVLTRLEIFQNEDLFAAGPNWDRLSRHHKVLRRY